LERSNGVVGKAGICWEVLEMENWEPAKEDPNIFS